MWAAGYSVLTGVGFVILFGISNRVWDENFMTSFHETSTGDHVQLTYYFWLWWHALTTLSHHPWLDPFQFAATGYVTHQPFGWPLVLVTIPVQAVFGPIAAFNAVFYASFVACAGSVYLWVRRFDVPPAAAAVAGFVFAFAPFRVAQRWHINALLSFLLPLALYFAERALRGPDRGARAAAWGCAASIVSLTASGEMHLVAYFAPVLLLYVFVRARGVDRARLSRLALPGIVAVAGSGFFLAVTYVFVHMPSYRSALDVTDAVTKYAPRPADLFRRGPPSERTAYPGAIAAVLAAIGAVWAVRRRALRPIAVLCLVLIVGSYTLAMLPADDRAGLSVYKAIPVISQIRVPGRIVIIAALAVSALAAFGAARLLARGRVATALISVALMLMVVIDSASMSRNVAAAAADGYLLKGVPKGAGVLELPPFDAGHFGASRYMLQLIYNPGPRVGGYSIFATTDAYRTQQLTKPLAQTPGDACRWRDVSQRMRFDYVAVHQALFGPHPRFPADGDTVIRALDASPAFTRLSETKDVVVYSFEPVKLDCGR